MLARQWQVAEFRGEDAGSPAFVEVEGIVRRLDGWGPRGSAQRPLDRRMPVESIALREPMARDDLSLRVELGHTFERLLPDDRRAQVSGEVRRIFPVRSVDPSAAALDSRSQRLLRVCAGRAIDGVALYDAVRAAGAELPAGLDLPPDTNAVTMDALAAFVRWVDDVFGAPGVDEPVAWQSEHLEYQLDVSAGATALAAHPERDASMDWFSYDLAPGTRPLEDGEPLRTSLLPGHIRFRGMPNARWWDFEDAAVDFGAIRPDKVDLARLVVMEFMLIHGNDWFQIPLELPVGSICRVSRLLVHDVFGVTSSVERAGGGARARGERWTMFTHVVEGTGQVSELVVVPQASAATRLVGPPLEEVIFSRDEMANLVWAIERVVADGVGLPWQGNDRDLAGRAAEPVPIESDVPPEASLVYRLESRTPVHWRPFLPVAIDPTRGEVALVQGAVFAIGENGAVVATQPAAKLLRGTPRVREEEVPRSAVAVVRNAYLARGEDGSSHLWIARRKGPGGGESYCGLRYDSALPPERRS